jgi:hypothetical protein
VITWIVVAVAVVAVAVALVAWSRARRAPAPLVTAPVEVDGIVSEPVPIAPDVRWAKQFAPHGATLDDDARRKLIDDLGFVRAAWCVPLLRQAYEEERDPALRRAALDALEACDPDAALALRTR